MTRKLASVQRIQEIKPIEGADAIEAYRVLGWWVVDKKDAHRVGDLVVYFEIDSWIKHELAPFLSKGRAPREYNGVLGERLRTVKLRGQLSQGLILPMETAFDWDEQMEMWEYRDHPEMTSETGEAIEYEDRVVIPVSFTTVYADEGDDITEMLGVQKWEPEIPANLAGQVRGTFPTHILPKTDQERIQNIFDEIKAKGDVTYEVTLKLDGTSCTVFRYEDEVRVCSRNLELKINPENTGNTLVSIANNIGDKIPDGYAVQGEAIGPGIQKNREGLNQHEFFVFDIYDITNQEYVTAAKRRLLCEEWGITHVPVIDAIAVAPESVDQGLEMADGPSLNHKIREGLVWKCNSDPEFSFKTISNRFLLKEDG